MMLEVDNLHTAYGKTRILQGATFNAPSSQVTCVLGRNGFGKSTTVKSVMGLTRSQSGSIRLNGTEIRGRQPHEIARLGVGYVPQDRRIFPTLTVLENLQMGITPGRKTKGRWSIDELMAAFPNLGKRQAAPGRALSGGEQQMLSVARALMGDPDVLMLDEPTEGLAPIMVDSLEAVIADAAQKGTAVLLVESKLSVALRLASEVYIIWKGKIIPAGTPLQLKENREMRREYLEV